MKVIEDRAPKGAVDYCLGEQADSVFAIICDECGEPITDLGSAIILMGLLQPGKEVKVVHIPKVHKLAESYRKGCRSEECKGNSREDREGREDRECRDSDREAQGFS